MIDFDGFQNYLYEEELSPNTVKSYLTSLRQFSEMFSEITKPNVIEFKRRSESSA